MHLAFDPFIKKAGFRARGCQSTSVHKYFQKLIAKVSDCYKLRRELTSKWKLNCPRKHCLVFPLYLPRLLRNKAIVERLMSLYSNMLDLNPKAWDLFNSNYIFGYFLPCRTLRFCSKLLTPKWNIASTYHIGVLLVTVTWFVKKHRWPPMKVPWGHDGQKKMCTWLSN